MALEEEDEGAGAQEHCVRIDFFLLSFMDVSRLILLSTNLVLTRMISSHLSCNLCYNLSLARITKQI
jgi:hypothetical protein